MLVLQVTSLSWFPDIMFGFNASGHPEAFQRMDSLLVDHVNAAGHQAYKEVCSQGEGP